MHEYGDFSNGLDSTGNLYKAIGSVDIINNQGKFLGSIRGNILDFIGRSLILKKNDEFYGGIMSRSAGVYENRKQVCSCSGKTIWEE
jgi:copper chaperone for superoxide dismutase